jgi:hypothetical protein
MATLNRPSSIDFDTDPRINPEISNFLRDFTREWTSYSSMCSPGWKLDEVIMHITSRLLFNFDFPRYYDYPPGLYRDELQVRLFSFDSMKSTHTLQVAVRLWLNNRLPAMRGAEPGSHFKPGIQCERSPELKFNPPIAPYPSVLPLTQLPPTPSSPIDLRNRIPLRGVSPTSNITSRPHKRKRTASTILGACCVPLPSNQTTPS